MATAIEILYAQLAHVSSSRVTSRLRSNDDKKSLLKKLHARKRMKANAVTCGVYFAAPSPELCLESEAVTNTDYMMPNTLDAAAIAAHQEQTTLARGYAQQRMKLENAGRASAGAGRR